MERAERREEGSSDERMSSGEREGRNGRGDPPDVSPGCERDAIPYNNITHTCE